MPNITLTWRPPYSSTVDQRTDAWIYDVVWKRGQEAFSTDAGIYAIENGAGDCIYAGEAGNFTNRFRTRNRVLREFRLAFQTTNPLGGYRVRVAEVSPTDQIPMAEHWFVRILHEQQQTAGTLLLQNIKLNDPFKTTEQLTITNANNNNRPNYLNASYTYQVNTEI